jgi:hypothetical protein
MENGGPGGSPMIMPGFKAARRVISVAGVVRRVSGANVKHFLLPVFVLSPSKPGGVNLLSVAFESCKTFVVQAADEDVTRRTGHCDEGTREESR